MSAAQTTGSEIVIRPINLGDLDVMFWIDRKIRATGEAITYSKLNSEQILTINRKVSRQIRPTSYADLITGDVRGLLEFSFVAEVNDHVRGFILGQITRIDNAAPDVGTILMLGVHPEYQRRGIATKLVNALLDNYHSKGIKKVRLGISTRDRGMIAFAEHVGFSTGHFVLYTKTL